MSDNFPISKRKKDEKAIDQQVAPLAQLLTKLEVEWKAKVLEKKGADADPQAVHQQIKIAMGLLRRNDFKADTRMTDSLLAECLSDRDIDETRHRIYEAIKAARATATTVGLR